MHEETAVSATMPRDHGSFHGAGRRNAIVATLMQLLSAGCAWQAAVAESNVVTGGMLAAIVFLALISLRQRTNPSPENIDEAKRYKANRATMKEHDFSDTAMDAIVAVDKEQRIVLFNRAAETMFGHAATAIIGEPLDILIPEKFQKSHRHHVEAYGATGTTRRSMGKLGVLAARRANGENFEIEVSISRTETDGRTLYVAIIRDVTEKRNAEKQKSLMMQELSHRLKNMLVLVQSIAYQTFRLSASPDDFQDSFATRLSALATAHDLLIESTCEGASLQDIVSTAMAPHVDAKATQWSFSGPALAMSQKATIMLSLAFHELATNSVKYGALGSPSGRVDISSTIQVLNGEAHLLLEWVETGGPRVAPPTRSGFGTRLLTRALCNELNGTTETEYLPQGIRCRITAHLTGNTEVANA